MTFPSAISSKNFSNLVGTPDTVFCHVLHFLFSSIFQQLRANPRAIDSPRLVRQFLLDVDDFMFGGVPQELNRVKEHVMSKYTLGKCVENVGDFIGRHVNLLEDRVLVDQEKYTLENLRVVDLARGRRSDHSAPASPSETRSFATLVYQLNWVGKESRAEVIGVSSLLASHVVNPTIAHVLEANRAAALLRKTASQRITIWFFP